MTCHRRAAAAGGGPTPQKSHVFGRFILLSGINGCGFTRGLNFRRRRTLLHGRAPWLDLRGSRELGPRSESGASGEGTTPNVATRRAPPVLPVGGVGSPPKDGARKCKGADEGPRAASVTGIGQRDGERSAATRDENERRSGAAEDCISGAVHRRGTRSLGRCVRGLLGGGAAWVSSDGPVTTYRRQARLAVTACGKRRGVNFVAAARSSRAMRAAPIMFRNISEVKHTADMTCRRASQSRLLPRPWQHADEGTCYRHKVLSTVYRRGM